MSAQTWSHRLQAPDIVLVSFPHDLISGEQPQNGDLGEAAEEGTAPSWDGDAALAGARF